MFTRSIGWTGAMLTATVLSAPLVATAGPQVFQETAKIVSPDPAYRFPGSIAVDGDWLIATGSRYTDEGWTDIDYSAWLFQRQSNGTWTLVRRLVQYIYPTDFDEPAMKVDVQGGVAAIIQEGSSWIFERSGTNWVSVASPIRTDGMDIAVNGGTILATEGYCGWSATAYRKGTNGAWQYVRSTEPQPDEFCENEDERGAIDVSGNANIVFTWGNDLFARSSARIFEGSYGTTNTLTMTRLLAPEGTIYDLWVPVAIDLPSALVGGEPNNGIYSFARDSSGVWSLTGTLVRPDSLALGYTGATTADARGGLAVVGYPLDGTYGTFSGSASVYQRNADNTYRSVAQLFASDRRPNQAFGRSDVSGRRVAVGGDSAVYIYDLPATFTQIATKQDGFEDGNASDWTPQAGSSFSVATSNSRVYRQASTTANAASIWSNTDRTHQSVQADIKPTAYATTTGDKWFGLVSRYIDANNYYYVTIRNNNTVLLRRMVNGVFTTLDSAPLTVTLNRTYRVRLETIGTRLRLFVDNQLLAEADDSSLSHGQAGVMMYKTRADYDNILVSTNPQTTLASYQFRGTGDSRENWETVGTWTEGNSEEGVYTQSDLTSGARAITGVAITDDQVVHGRMRRTSGAATNNWFGLAARYRDPGNYYYFTLRNDNTIALRKLVNNAIVELDVAPFTVTANAWYRARFEAVGSQLRVYINDALILEATDTSHATGRYGPIMYRAATEYDDIFAVQP
ncbi:MAG TPA: hypothetical protein VIU34_27045 [Steroidobacter sp.]